jgi:hypothetical protein
MFFHDNELKCLFLKAKVKQFEVAQALGISISYMSQLANGYCDCNDEMLAKINKFLASRSKSS